MKPLVVFTLLCIGDDKALAEAEGRADAVAELEKLAGYVRNLGNVIDDPPTPDDERYVWAKLFWVATRWRTHEDYRGAIRTAPQEFRPARTDAQS